MTTAAAPVQPAIADDDIGGGDLRLERLIRGCSPAAVAAELGVTRQRVAFLEASPRVTPATAAKVRAAIAVAALAKSRR